MSDELQYMIGVAVIILAMGAAFGLAAWLGTP